MVEPFRGRDLDPHYLAFFACFNQELFFEAHEVLEILWLKERGGPKAGFYKGLIQLAGAFVHLQKARPKPAAALFRLARENLRGYPAQCDGLAVGRVCEVIGRWLGQLQTCADSGQPFPKLRLE